MSSPPTQVARPNTFSRAARLAKWTAAEYPRLPANRPSCKTTFHVCIGSARLEFKQLGRPAAFSALPRICMSLSRSSRSFFLGPLYKHARLACGAFTRASRLHHSAPRTAGSAVRLRMAGGGFFAAAVTFSHGPAHLSSNACECGGGK